MCGLIALKSEYFKHTFELWIIHHLHFQCWSTITVLFMQINYSVYNQWNPNYWIWGVALKIKCLSEFGRVAVYAIFLVSWTSQFYSEWFYLQVFAAPYSLRFPRIDRVRYDKAWHECLDVQCKGLTQYVFAYSLVILLQG
jgi:hypothetical protein